MRNLFLLLLMGLGMFKLSAQCVTTYSTDTQVSCGSYTWMDGVTYTSSNNSATDTLVNAAGCDSVITLNLTINQPTSGTDVVTACDDYTWIDGVTYTTSNNSATHTLVNAAGCDSVVTLNLTIHESTSSTDVISACVSYTWIDGVTYTASNNSATYTTTNANGCDSVITLDLTINSPTSSTFTTTACDSFTWTNGVTYYASNNTAMDTLVNAAGCDLYMRLNLTITNSTSSTFTVSACDSYTWVDGITYTESNNSATKTYTNAAGCDSVVTLDLTILSNSSTFTTSACESYTWIDGITYTSSNNTATQTLTNVNGCDSVVTLDLTILNPTSSTETVRACNSFTWTNGVTYTSSNNTAKDTFVNAAGCDSIVSLDLIVNYSKSSTDVISSCGSYTWTDGITYTTSNNTATNTYFSAQGCDSVVTLNLTILSNESTDVQSACDSYTWTNGVTYTSSNNTATDTFTNIHGCDSVVTLDLTILSNGSTFTVASCDSFTWVDGVTYYTSNNTATFTYLNVAGCDSIVTLDLTVNNATTSTDLITACDRYTWTNGITYFADNNTAKDTFATVNGCDSIVTLDLTILPINGSIDVVTECGNFTWTNGITYTSSNNTATDTFTNIIGCDSIVTLNLTILPESASTYEAEACDSFTWIDGITYYASNNSATMKYTNSVGCDSIVTLDLTINETVFTTDEITACDSYTWTNGVTYTSSNYIAKDTHQTVHGCDSIVTLELTINYSQTSTDKILACASYTWIDGVTYTSSNNTATHTLTSSKGCDSVVTLDLTIRNSSTTTDVITACGSYTWINGFTYTFSNNTSVYTIVTEAGCDSVVKLDLTILSPDETTDVITACESYTWIDGVTYTSSTNTPTYTLTNVSGCDSIVTLDLTINKTTFGVDEITACDAYTWIDGVEYTESNNTATHTVTNSLGCDSVVTLDLTINKSVSRTDVIVACNSYRWINGTTYTESNNTALRRYLTADGCDSIVYLDLTINKSTSGVDVVEACNSYTWIDGVTYTSSTDAPSFTLTNAAGCDSVVTLNLTITSLDNSVSIADPKINANDETATYQWIDCDNGNAPIDGATGQEFVATDNGSYAVIVTKGECSDTSECVTISKASARDNIVFEGVTVYPNPTSNVVNVDLANLSNVNIVVTDLNGKVVYNAMNIAGIKHQFVLDASKGMYIVEIQSDQKRMRTKLIKQ